MIVVNINGTETNLNTLFKVTDFKISSPAFSYYSEKIENRLGQVMTGQTLDKRTLEVTGYIRSDFVTVRDNLFGLLCEESFELYDTRVPNKIWTVSTDSIDIDQSTENFGKVKIKFTSFQGYCRTKETRTAISTSNTFTVTNSGNLIVDPRVHNLRIELRGDVTKALTITNQTTNESIVFNTTMSGNSVIAVDGIQYKKDGALITSKTNRKLISLAKGINNFTVEGLTASKIRVIYNEYYL